MSEINKALEAIKKEEETKQNQVEVFEKQLAGRCEDLESKYNAALELIEKNNEKISSLESSLKETRDTLNQVLNKQLLNKNQKNNTSEDAPEFTCKMCDFQSRSKSGLRNHIARKHSRDW